MALAGGCQFSSSFLRNRYWILRHGKSTPNEKGLIVSSLVPSSLKSLFANATLLFFHLLTHSFQENGILEDYQLATHGILQARLAAESLLKELDENKIGLENVRICYSPFARTIHTAKVVASVLNIPFQGPQCKVVQDFRERFFGPSFELKSHDKYPEIWAMDERNPFMQPEGGESVSDVATRLTRALAMIESEYEKCAVLVVSHGDPLQILQTITNAAKKYGETSETDFMAIIPAILVPSVLSQHRKFALDTGELRQLV